MNFLRFDEMEILRDKVTLPDERGTGGAPVTVMEYRDPASGRIYQVDYRNRRFRARSTDGAAYGEWQKFGALGKS